MRQARRRAARAAGEFGGLARSPALDDEEEQRLALLGAQRGQRRLEVARGEDAGPGVRALVDRLGGGVQGRELHQAPAAVAVDEQVADRGEEKGLARPGRPAGFVQAAPGVLHEVLGVGRGGAQRQGVAVARLEQVPLHFGARRRALVTCV